jgi:hypothetical protein
VGNDLDGRSEVFTLALLLDDVRVDAARRDVRRAGDLRVRVALVVTEVEVGLGAVVRDVDLAVLVGAHGARVDVDVGIELLHADPQSAALEKHADRGRRREPFPSDDTTPPVTKMYLAMDQFPAFANHRATKSA